MGDQASEYDRIAGGASFQNRQATPKSNLASKHTFVALNLVLYCTFSAYIIKFQLLLNCMPQKVGDCTRHGRELISQPIVVMSSDWIGRGKSNYQNNSNLYVSHMHSVLTEMNLPIPE